MCDDKCENRITNIECNDKICYFGPYCSNRSNQNLTYTEPKYELVKTKRKGYAYD